MNCATSEVFETVNKENATVNEVDRMSVLTVVRYCEMLPFYQVCIVTVEDSKWPNAVCIAGFSAFVRTSPAARGKKVHLFTMWTV